MTASYSESLTLADVPGCPSCVGAYSLQQGINHHQRPVYKLTSGDRFLAMERPSCSWIIQDSSGVLYGYSPAATTACDPASAFP